MKVRVRLDTLGDIAAFVLAVNDVKSMVYLTNDNNLRVDYSLSFSLLLS